MTARRIARYAKLVLHDEVCAWLALGWMLDRDLNGRYPCDGEREGEYAALLVWPCDCQVRRPPKSDERDVLQTPQWKLRDEKLRAIGLAGACAEQRDCQRDRDEEREFGWSV